MPSPFPGMDPWLEDPGLWPDVHNNLISEMQAALNARLRPKYHVRIEERVYITGEDDPGLERIIPDLKIREIEPSIPASDAAATVGVAVAEPIVATTLLDDEIHEPFLKIVDRADQGVITVIEILSPTNKYPGARGYEQYRAKRQDVMWSSSHFVEIDLLRAGRRMKTRGRVPASDYLVHISRSDERPRGRLWAMSLRQPLPEIPVPLRAIGEETPLNLQSLLDSVYDRAAYDLVVDYRRDPVPPLSPELAAWEDELLRSKSLR